MLRKLLSMIFRKKTFTLNKKNDYSSGVFYFRGKLYGIIIPFTPLIYKNKLTIQSDIVNLPGSQIKNHHIFYVNDSQWTSLNSENLQIKKKMFQEHLKIFAVQEALKEEYKI